MFVAGFFLWLVFWLATITLLEHCYIFIVFPLISKALAGHSLLKMGLYMCLCISIYMCSYMKQLQE